MIFSQRNAIACFLIVLFLVGCEEKNQRMKDLAKAINETKTTYNNAGTTHLKENAIAARHEALKQFTAKDKTFSGFLCEVENVRTKGGKEDLFTKETIAVLTVNCGDFTLLNMDTTALEGVPENAILFNTETFDTVVKMNSGEKVAVDGEFIFDRKGNLREASITDGGMMSHPEFVVKFTKVKKQ